MIARLFLGLTDYRRFKSSIMKNVTGFFISLLIAASGYAQRNKQISVAFLNTGSAYLFAEFSKLITTVQNPGIELGYGFNWKTKPKHDWFQEFKLSYFYHRFVQHVIPLYTDIGYRYKFSSSLSAQASLGAGYMQSIPATAKLKLDANANGEYKKDKGIGRAQAIAVVGFSIGYIIHSSVKNAPRFFITYQQFLQTPFVKAYVPILPYNSLIIGWGIPFRSHKKTAS
ncbi:MAG: hypothetical protein ACRDE5_06310 [Ginsengibacter sp.]